MSLRFPQDCDMTDDQAGRVVTRPSDALDITSRHHAKQITELQREKAELEAQVEYLREALRYYTRFENEGEIARRVLARLDLDGRERQEET